MLLKITWSADGETLVIQNDQDGMAYIADNWPQQVKPEDLLQALFGRPNSQGQYAYHEPDHRWLFQCLETVRGFSSDELAVVAIQDMSGVQLMNFETSPSRVTAGSLATLLIHRAFQVPRNKAAWVVRMNLDVEQAA